MEFSLSNHPCQAQPTLNVKVNVNVNVTSDVTLFYPFTASVNKCGGSWNSIDGPYARVFVPNKVKT